MEIGPPRTASAAPLAATLLRAAKRARGNKLGDKAAVFRAIGLVEQATAPVQALATEPAVVSAAATGPPAEVPTALAAGTCRAAVAEIATRSGEGLAGTGDTTARAHARAAAAGHPASDHVAAEDSVEVAVAGGADKPLVRAMTGARL